MVDRFAGCYNDERLHSTIGYVTPKIKREGREVMIFADRKRNLAQARKRRSLAVKQAKAKLKNRGYEGPTVADESAESQKAENHCTVKQISAMVKAGMTESQIEAACGETN